MIVSPVHEAARTARRFSSGHLEARMRVRGQDDLAQLAVSFNEMAGTLQSQIDELEKLSSVQQQFVADVSHELRTPLTTVRMAADLLHDKRQELPRDDARAVELLQNQLNRFEALLADLLETSRAGRRLRPAGLRGGGPAAAMCRAGGGRPASRSPRSSTARCEVIGSTSLVVPCDAQRVERILANLHLQRPRARHGPAGGRRGDAARATRRSWPSPTRAWA